MSYLIDLIPWYVWAGAGGLVLLCFIPVVGPIVLGVLGGLVRFARATWTVLPDRAKLALGIMAALGALVVLHFWDVREKVKVAVAVEHQAGLDRAAEQKRLNDDAVKALDAEYRRSEKDHKAALAALGAQHEKKVAAIKAQRDRDLADARSGAIRLSIAASCGHANASTPAEAGTAAAVSDGEARTELPAEITANLLTLANDADEVVEQLSACQRVIESDRQSTPLGASP